MITGSMAIILLLGTFACEDDALVEPMQDKDDDNCTGSYCKLDLDKSAEKEAIQLALAKENPTTY